MAKAGFAITVVSVFNLIIVPSCAFPDIFPFPKVFNPFPFGDLGSEQPLPVPVRKQQPIDKPQPAPDQQRLVQPQAPYIPQTYQSQSVGQKSLVDLPNERNEQKKSQKNKPQNKFSDKLEEGFYSESCPNAEQIVANAVAEIFKTNPDATASLIRLQFHDCFVGGCDASILLDSVASGDKVEKASAINGELLKGADLIDDIKYKLEEECPGKVSCADVVAFAASESMVMAGLPLHPKLGGRRDALVSLATNAEDNNMPLPNWSMDQVLQVFKNKGFNEEDTVVLIGAHSLGSAHCASFTDRIYNYHGSGNPDPVVPQDFLAELQQKCVKPAPGIGGPRTNVRLNFDETPTKIDNLFFKNLVEKKRALLAIDQALLTDPRTASTVEKIAADPNFFTERFVDAMMRMSSLGVLTGRKGQVRKTCRSTD